VPKFSPQRRGGDVEDQTDLTQRQVNLLLAGRDVRRLGNTLLAGELEVLDPTPIDGATIDRRILIIYVELHR